MGMFDYIRCEMPLPEPAPPAGSEFQTKDTDAQYMERYTITADGRLIHHTVRYEDTPKEKLPYPDAEPGSALSLAGCITKVPTGDVEIPLHGDIGFGKFDDKSGEDWDYVARFTEGRCVRIWLEEHRPATHKPVAVTVPETMPLIERIAALKSAGFIFHDGRDRPDNASLNGRHDFIRDEGQGTITYRMWFPIASSPTPASSPLDVGVA